MSSVNCIQRRIGEFPKMTLCPIHCFATGFFCRRGIMSQGDYDQLFGLGTLHAVSNVTERCQLWTKQFYTISHRWRRPVRQDNSDDFSINTTSIQNSTPDDQRHIIIITLDMSHTICFCFCHSSHIAFHNCDYAKQCARCANHLPLLPGFVCAFLPFYRIASRTRTLRHRVCHTWICVYWLELSGHVCWKWRLQNTFSNLSALPRVSCLHID